MKQPSRCAWVDLTKPDYIDYHDREWGVPCFDDRKLFEFLILEGAQAGLSWYTILRKRSSYRQLYDFFDPALVARYTDGKMARLMADPGIVRNRLKIEASVTNARRFLAIQEEFGSFCQYLWRFVGGRPIVNTLSNSADYPVTSPQSDALSKDLQQRGFKFVGSTICYAYMQATGLVNDHTLGCFRREQIIQLSSKATGPF